jgi:hypothetical protein
VRIAVKARCLNQSLERHSAGMTSKHSSSIKHDGIDCTYSMCRPSLLLRLVIPKIIHPFFSELNFEKIKGYF